MSSLSILFSSDVKACLVRELFAATAKPLHGRELARRCNCSLSAVQRELKRMVADGLIVESQDGNRTNYQANSQHPFFQELCSLVRKSDGITVAVAEALKGCGATFAFVFGSLANQTADSVSDVDVMVIGDVKLRQIVSLLSGLGNDLGREINPHVFSLSEWRHRITSNDHFIRTVMSGDKHFVVGDRDEFERMAK